MSTHRITIELTEAAYAIVRQSVDSGAFDSEEAAINHSLEALDTFDDQDDETPGMQPGDPEFERWMREEVIPSAEQVDAEPDSVLTGEQLLAYLAEQRAARRKAVCHSG